MGAPPQALQRGAYIPLADKARETSARETSSLSTGMLTFDIA